MTVSALHKKLSELMEAGHARKPIAINKRTFRHALEDDGAVILEVHGVEGPRWICSIDDDGGPKINQDGSEAGKRIVVLLGCAKDED
jgi:hypothetical protein